MKILQLIQKKQNRGAETFACQLSNHLIELGHELKIVALHNGKAKLPFKGAIEILEAYSENRFLDHKAWRKLSRIINQFQPDIVQANAGDTLKYAVFSKKLFGWKAPIVSRNASEVGRYLKSPIQKKINTFFYKNVDYVISVSKASEKDVLKHFPLLSNKTCVIPVGLEKISQIKKITLEPEEVQHIVHVGGFTFEKNHFGLLRIFKSVLKFMPKIHLHLVGDGFLKPRIEKEVEKMNLTPHVTFYGFVTNPLSYIKSGDVLILPSIIEGLPGVLLEAMFCKTPVITYDIGGISEIVNPGSKNLITKDHESDFANAIMEKLENPDLEQIENLYRMVVEEYMNEELSKKFLDIYEKIVI